MPRQRRRSTRQARPSIQRLCQCVLEGSIASPCLAAIEPRQFRTVPRMNWYLGPVGFVSFDAAAGGSRGRERQWRRHNRLAYRRAHAGEGRCAVPLPTSLAKAYGSSTTLRARNYGFELWSANEDEGRLPGLAAELVRLDIDVIARGWMFWLWRKTLSGSYVVFTSTSRS
jgi:hypothetical protein